MTNLTVDKTGTIQFDVLEVGDYKFIIQTPENSKGNKEKKEKAIEKASSGLKDTLKHVNIGVFKTLLFSNLFSDLIKVSLTSIYGLPH